MKKHHCEICFKYKSFGEYSMVKWVMGIEAMILCICHSCKEIIANKQIQPTQKRAAEFERSFS